MDNNISSIQVFNSSTCPVVEVSNAQFISQSVPTQMVAGQTYQVSVTMKNNGTKTWKQAENFRLGSQNPQDNATWGTGRVNMNAGEQIAAGQNKTFTFNVVAPSAAGTYNFQWKMLQEGVQWFGGTSTNVAVQVITDYLNTSSTWYQESEARLHYTGSWVLKSSTSATGNKYKQTGIQGAYVEFRINSNAFTLRRRMGTDRGNMTVCIDANCQTISNYASSTKWKQAIEFKNIPGSGIHTVRITNAQAKNMDIDAILVWNFVMNPLTASSTWYQESNANLVYTNIGAWTKKSSTSASGGKYIQTSTAGSYVEFKIQSNAFTLKRKIGTDRGNMSVCIE
jgi:hypothetical protein